MFKKTKNFLKEYYSKESKEERLINSHMKIYKLSRSEAIEKVEENRIKLGFKNNGYLEKRNAGILCCPVCLGENISTNQKGFGAGKAAMGATAFGSMGIAAGGIGSKKINCTCLDCGKKFNPKYK